MIVQAIKTRVLIPPKDDLIEALYQAIDQIEENSILAVTSKAVSIWQGRCIRAEDYPNKDELIKEEAQMYLPRKFVPGGWIMHTVKDGLFVPSAGVDLSNGRNFYILWPQSPMQAAAEIRSHIKQKFNLKKAGVIITDSHSVPLHRGVVGITLGFAGFSPIKDYRGSLDLFGREFTMEIANVADMIATAAVLTMGEGAEQTPAALISDVAFVEFMENYKDPDKPFSSFNVPIEEDLYGPFITSAPWKKGRK